MPSTHIKHALGFLLVPVLAFLFARGVTACYGSWHDTRHLITEERHAGSPRHWTRSASAQSPDPDCRGRIAPLSPDTWIGPAGCLDRPFVYAPSVDKPVGRHHQLRRDGSRVGGETRPTSAPPSVLPTVPACAGGSAGSAGRFFCPARRLSRRAVFRLGRRHAAGTAALLGLVLLRRSSATVLDASPRGS